jgi:hypothetical protein
MRRFGWFVAVLCFALPGFTGCETPADPGGGPEPEPEGLRAGLYAFSGDYVPGETETTAEPVAVLPFSLENALAEINAAETPRSYLILADKEFSFLTTASLPAGTSLALKGLGGERVVQFYNAEAGGGLFSFSGGQTLILDENITLLGSKANGNPLISLENNSRLVFYGGASIQEHGGLAVQALSGGEFILDGGTIESCGGGARVAGGVFTMKSGSIAGNGGSGVTVNSGGVFAMEGGSIAGNGGGVSVASGGRFTLKDGAITGGISGGGVVNRGTFVMEGGLISGNHNASAGGGVSGNFSISGGSITGNTSDDPDPLYKNINAVPLASGDAFVIEGYREVTGIAITLIDSYGHVKTRAVGGRTYVCSAVVLGVGGPPQEASWSLSGNTSAGTTLDPASGELRVGSDEAAETLFITATSTARPEVFQTLELGVDLFVERNLKIKLGVATPNSIAVITEVFNALHEYIAAGHLSEGNEKDIGPGDYVDLYRLRVNDTVTAGYNRGTLDMMNTAAVSDSATLRMVVVGVNSYQGLNGNAGDHLEFQFQNALTTRRINNQGSVGYAESEIRKYLSPVEGVENSGCFHAGLVAAGIPETVFYSPRREASGGEGIVILEDPVWFTAGDLSAFVAKTYPSEGVAPAFCVR